MMMRRGAEDPDSIKAHGTPRRHDLTGQQPPTMEMTKPTLSKEPQQQQHATEQQPQRPTASQQQKLQRPHPRPPFHADRTILTPHSNIIVEVLQLKLKESAKRR